MKVICIDGERRIGDFSNTPMVTEGCIYNTVCTCNGYGADGSIVLSYKLQGFSLKYCYDCDRFIPLSDISETEMKRNYKIADVRDRNNQVYQRLYSFPDDGLKYYQPY